MNDVEARFSNVTRFDDAPFERAGAGGMATGRSRGAHPVMQAMNPRGSSTTSVSGRSAVVALVLGLAACTQDAPQTREGLIATIRTNGVSDPRVLEALASVPRDEFVPPGERRHAWEDRSLPIEDGQRITQPSLVGTMTQLLQLAPGDKVLEIGTGSGYQAAILARLTEHVFSVELLPDLAATARQRLARLKYSTVSLKTGDGYLGWPEQAPFDAIIVTCAPDHVPGPLVAQLKEGGRIAIPVGPEDGPQTLYLVRKQAGGLVSVSVEPVHFVPFVREPRPALHGARLDDQLFAFLFSLLVEIPIALLCCARDRRTALATVGAALVATGLTHPFAWWAITAWSAALGWAGATAIVELALTALEALAYRGLAGVTWRRAFATSALANAA